MEELEEPIDYKALLDRLEIIIDRINKPKIYSRRRRSRYHKLGLKHLELLRLQLE
ncbi:MAG: hypothetical protein AAF518_25135 [Spirochaetota bacterium]